MIINSTKVGKVTKIEPKHAYVQIPETSKQILVSRDHTEFNESSFKSLKLNDSVEIYIEQPYGMVEIAKTLTPYKPKTTFTKKKLDKMLSFYASEALTLNDSSQVYLNSPTQKNKLPYHTVKTENYRIEDNQLYLQLTSTKDQVQGLRSMIDQHAHGPEFNCSNEEYLKNFISTYFKGLVEAYYCSKTEGYYLIHKLKPSSTKEDLKQASQKLKQFIPDFKVKITETAEVFL